MQRVEEGRRGGIVSLGYGLQLVMAGKRFLSEGLFSRGWPEDYALGLHGRLFARIVGTKLQLST